MLVFALAQLLMLHPRIECSIRDIRFVKNILCDVTERLSDGCSVKVAKPSISVLNCVTICSYDVTCRGASVDDNGSCFIHMDCPGLDTTCLSPTGNHHYVAKWCVNGVWNAATTSCLCRHPYTGSRCDKASYPKDCPALVDLGYKTGFHRVYIDPDEDGSNPVQVVCDVSLPSWFSIVFMRNEGSNMDFNRTWREYRQGFFQDLNNFWCGLDVWAALNQAGYKSVFTVNTGSGSMYREYKGLALTNAADGYRVTFVDTSRVETYPFLPDFGDCLTPVLGLQFSTWDVDNDGNETENCAARAGSGGWYLADCSTPCNMFGWGFDHWSSKTSYQRFFVLGIDLNDYSSNFIHLEIYMQN